MNKWSLKKINELPIDKKCRCKTNKQKIKCVILMFSWFSCLQVINNINQLSLLASDYRNEENIIKHLKQLDFVTL